MHRNRIIEQLERQWNPRMHSISHSDETTHTEDPHSRQLHEKTVGKSRLLPKFERCNDCCHPLDDSASWSWLPFQRL